jgi:OOP family OmpA-OmpF porin
MHSLRATAFLFIPLTACAASTPELVSLPGAHISAALPAPEPPKEVAKAVVEPEPAAVQVTSGHIAIEEKIQFEPWSAKILDSSNSILNEVAAVLRKSPNITKIEIQGHTARTGQAKRALKLSRDRAMAVRDFLIQRGVVKDRLEAKGYGESQPIANNGTKEGREKNRRVEFVIVEQEQQVAMVNGGKQ